MANKAQVIPVSKLVLDQANARIGVVHDSQDETVVALAEKIGVQLAEIAQDIVAYGLDPTVLVAVTPEGAPAGKFRVIEGNRRMLAVKSLKKPKILESANLSSAVRKRIASLSTEFALEPIRAANCVVFDTEDEARHWIELRHTGSNNGVGLVQWDANEKDRYRSRHKGAHGRSLGGQVLDFVNKFYPPNGNSLDRILTNIQRLVSDPDVRKLLGLGMSDKVLYSHYPAEEVLKGLYAIVSDLRDEVINVGEVYHKSDRATYMGKFGADRLPDPSNRLDAPVALAGLEAAPDGAGPIVSGPDTPSLGRTVGPASGSANPGVAGSVAASNLPVSAQPGTGTGSASGQLPGAGVNSTSGASKSRVRPRSDREFVIPNSCHLWITDGRINSIYHELLTLNVNSYVNACAVLLRVFVELSVDHHILAKSILSEDQRRNMPLAKRLKLLAEDFRQKGEIDAQLESTVKKIADGVGVLGASTVTFNQYVHNKTTFPISSDLRVSWDELQPFMSVLWKK